MSLAVSYANYAPTWWTPEPWMLWVRETLGDPVFDPCPRDWADGKPSGLDIPWEPNTYVNHPGDRKRSAQRWWDKYLHEYMRSMRGLVWCAFNIEQLRHIKPSPFELPGYLVLPDQRTAFLWGGEDGYKGRIRGEPCKSPGNWAVWWTNCEPTKPPVPSLIVKTGLDHNRTF